MGVQKLRGVLEKLWVCCFLVGDWWGNGNCRGVFSMGSIGGGSPQLVPLVQLMFETLNTPYTEVRSGPRVWSLYSRNNHGTCF